MRKNKKNFIVTLSTIIVFSLVFSIKLVYADGFSDTIIKMIGEVIAFFGDAIVWLCDALGGKFDKLIFNYDGDTFNKDLNLTILKNNEISKQVLILYSLMQYIGTCILVPISFVITLDFLRVGNDSRHKAVLKLRLQKLVLSLFLLNSIPNIVDIMFAFNTVFTDVCRLVSKAFVSGNNNIDFGKSFLTAVFRGLIDKATGKEALIDSIVYLIAALVNVWVIIFYMIRDLTITFLLIFAPILVCILPFRTDLLVSWFKEMFSNIITQSIQAVVFTVVIAFVAGLSSASDLYADVFALVAFAMFIPITAIIKRLLGLEGDIGAAKSAAGLGAAVMTMALAGKAANGIKNKAGMLKDSHEKIKDLKAERDNIGKMSRGNSPLQNFNSNKGFGVSSSRGLGNLSAGIAALGGVEGAVGEMGTGMAMASTFTGGGSYTGGNYNPLPSKQVSRDRDTIQGEINSVKKQAFKSLSGGVFSALGSGVMAAAGSAYGPMGAFMGMQLGGSIGESIGSLGATGISKVGSSLSEKGKDILYGEGIRPELSAINNGNKSWGLGNVKYNMNNMKKNMSDNINAMKSDMQYGWYNNNVKPHTDEEKEELNIAKEARQDEITGLTGDPLRDTNQYANEKDSRIQTQKLVRQGDFAKASRYRLQTSTPLINEQGIKNFEDNISNPNFTSKAMLYTDKNSSILFNQNNETGEREVLATLPGNPNLETPTMESVEFDNDGVIPISDNFRNSCREQAVNIAVQRYGSGSISDAGNSYYNDAQSFIQKETNNLINQHIQRNENLRQSVGSSKIHVTGNIMNYENVDGLNSIPNSVPPDVSVNIPENLNNKSQHLKDVYSNVEMGRITLNLKQAEYQQQRQYTDNLIQGANEIHYNKTNFNTNRKM